MLDLIQKLNTDWDFSSKLQVACGANHKFIFMGVTGNSKNMIKGMIRITLSEDKWTLMPMRWDRYGFPLDLKQFPSKYYIRLVVR